MAEIVKKVIYVTVQGSNKVIEITPAFRGVTLTEVKNDTDIANTIANTHTHTNKALLDEYTPENFATSNHTHDNRYYTETEVDTLLSGKSDVTHNHTLSSLLEKSYNSLTDKPDLSSLHTHLNKSALDNLTQTVINNSHSHSNQTLLDSYTNTNTDITNAVNNTHSHPNKTDLDNYSPNNFAPSNHNHDSLYYQKSEVDNALSQKQNTLVSGVNIKTINNQSILSSGDMTIFGMSNTPIYDNGTKTVAFNIDYSNGAVQKVTLGASLAFGISDPSDTSKAHTLYLYVYQDTTGGRLWNGINGTNIALSSDGNKYKQLLSAPYGMYYGSKNAVMSADNNLIIWWYVNRMYYYNISYKRLFTSFTSPYTLYYTSDIICYNNKYYMFGGSSTASGGTYYDYFIEFDWANYTNIAPTTRPSARINAHLVLYNNKAYLFGGYNGSSTFSDLWVYDFSSGTWTQLASCPVAIRGGITFVYNNELYFGVGTSSSLYAYNPTNNTWRDATPVGLSGLFGYNCAYAYNTIENKVYIFGVSNAYGQNSHQTGYIDLATNKFYLMQDVDGINGISAVSAYNPAENCIYIIHGASTSISFLARFNPPHGGELTKEILNTLPNAITLLLFQWDGTKWVLMNR